MTIFERLLGITPPVHPQPYVAPAPVVQVGVNIRPMQYGRDIAEVYGIEQQCFSYQWSDEDWVRAVSHCKNGALVAQCNCGCDVVYGYMVYTQRPYCYEILNLAVKPRLQGHGIGRQLVDRVKLLRSQTDRVAVRANVRETNLDAQKFFAACGFRASPTILRGWFGDDESAYQFVYREAKRRDEECSGR